MKGHGMQIATWNVNSLAVRLHDSSDGANALAINQRQCTLRTL